MKKTLAPLERIEQLDTLWSWFERFGLVKTMLIAIGAGGLVTYIVAWFQSVPRWIILTLVFLVSTLLVLAVFAGIVWIVSWTQKRI